MSNKDLLNELSEMINRMNRTLDIYRANLKVAKELNVVMPLEYKNKMAGLAAMVNICEKVSYFYNFKDDTLFGVLVETNDQPEPEESKIAINLLNQYLDLKHEVGSVEYFIPDELKGKWGIIMTMNGKQAIVSLIEIIMLMIGLFFICNENILNNIILDIIIRLIAIVYCGAVIYFSNLIKIRLEDAWK